MQIHHLQQKIENFLNTQTGINAAVRIGSAGRGQLGPNSDLDYQLVLKESAPPETILQAAQAHFGSLLHRAVQPAGLDKLAFFLGERLALCELHFYRKKEDLDRYFLGSEIRDAGQSIVFDRTGTLTAYLQQRAEVWRANQESRLKKEAGRLLDEFELRFEACSRAHARSDGYKFSVLFGQALNAVVRLVWLASGERQFDFMPSNFLTKYSHPLQLGLDKLGQIDLRTAHFQKQHLLRLFAEWAPKAIARFGLKTNFSERSAFLDRIIARDRFWNLRDASKFNDRLRPGRIFRSAAFCQVNPAEDAQAFLAEKGIRTVIDLRAEREYADMPYTDAHLGAARHVHVPFDPWAQSKNFQNAHAHLTDHSIIAYHFFLQECKDSMRKVFSLLAASNGALLIHCHAGKDRTGIVLTLLHLLSGAGEEAVRHDYYASEMDTRPELLDVVLDEIANQGGVVSYLKNCGITDAEIQKIRESLCLYPMN